MGRSAGHLKLRFLRLAHIREVVHLHPYPLISSTITMPSVLLSRAALRRELPRIAKQARELHVDNTLNNVSRPRTCVGYG